MNRESHISPTLRKFFVAVCIVYSYARNIIDLFVSRDDCKRFWKNRKRFQPMAIYARIETKFYELISITSNLFKIRFVFYVVQFAESISN